MQTNPLATAQNVSGLYRGKVYEACAQHDGRHVEITTILQFGYSLLNHYEGNVSEKTFSKQYINLSAKHCRTTAR